MRAETLYAQYVASVPNPAPFDLFEAEIRRLLRRATQNQADAIARVFGPLTPISQTHPMYYSLWVDSPQECRPCETGLISETTECEHCQFTCKVKTDSDSIGVPNEQA